MNEDGITREPIYAIFGKVPGSDVRNRVTLNPIGFICKMYQDDAPNCPDYVVKGDLDVGSDKTLEGIKDKVRAVMGNVEFFEFVRATKGE